MCLRSSTTAVSFELCQPTGLILKNSDSNLANLVNPNEGTVDESRLALRSSFHGSKNFGLKAGILLAAPTAAVRIATSPNAKNLPSIDIPLAGAEALPKGHS